MPHLLPGAALASLLALIAWLGGQMFPLLGGAVLAILLGVLVRTRWTPPAVYLPGIRFTGKYGLQTAVVLLGFGLDFTHVMRTGRDSLTMILITLAFAFITAWGLGKLLRVQGKLSALIGIGTAICGGSAIAAAAPILQPDEHDTAFAMSTIFLFNLIAVLIFPPLGHLLHMDATQFGLWAGTAINDTSSVVAAGYAFSREAGDYATIVKLARASMILPICLALAAAMAWHRHRHQQATTSQLRFSHILPWFILWFVAASACRSTGMVPDALQARLPLLGGLLMLVALAAIGLSADLQRMRSTGIRPIALGLGVWIAVAGGSLLVQAL